MYQPSEYQFDLQNRLQRLAQRNHEQLRELVHRLLGKDVRTA